MRNRLLCKTSVDQRELLDVVPVSRHIHIAVPVRRNPVEFTSHCTRNRFDDIVSIRIEPPRIIAVDQVESALLSSRNQFIWVEAGLVRQNQRSGRTQVQILLLELQLVIRREEVRQT